MLDCVVTVSNMPSIADGVVHGVHVCCLIVNDVL